MPVKRKNNNQKKVYGSLEEDDKDEKFLTCFICSVQEKWMDHQKKPEHQSKLKFFSENFVDVSDVNVRCKICKSLVPKLAFEKHAGKKHQLIPWHRPENENTTLFKNNITKVDEKYRCHLCDETSNYWYESIKHTESKSHLEIRNKSTRLNDLNTKDLTEKLSQQFVTNGIIFFNCTQLRCWTCDCVIVGYDNAGKHIVSESHKSNLFKKKELVSQKCDAVSATITAVDDNFPMYLDNFILKRCNDYYCNLCDNNYPSLSMIINHIKDPEHKNALSRKRQLHSISSAPFKPNICESLVKNNIFEFDSHQLECYSCNFIISSYSNLEDHINSKNHKTNLGFVSTTNLSPTKCNDTVNNGPESPGISEYFPQNADNVIKKIRDGYYCHLCNIQFSTSSEVMTHLYQQEHVDLGAVKGISQIIVDQNSTSFNYCPENHVVCKFCNISIPKDSIIEHAFKKHQSMPWLKPENEFIIYFKNFITPNNNYYCYICNTANNRWYLALEHTKSVNHSDCLKMFVDDEDINEEALKQCEKYVNNSIFPFTSTKLRCWKCNFIIDGLENAEKHVSSDEHKNVFKDSNCLISASEVPVGIIFYDSHGINLDSKYSVGEKESNLCEIKSNNSPNRSNLSDSSEKNLNINDSKTSNSSGYASVNATINNDSSDEQNESSLVQLTSVEGKQFLERSKGSLQKNDHYLLCNNSNSNFCAGTEIVPDIENEDNDDSVEADHLFKNISSRNLPHKETTDNNRVVNNNSELLNTDLLSDALKDLSILKRLISNENQDNVNIAIARKQNDCVPDQKSLSELEDLYIEYFENCIFTWNSRYYCSLCQVHLSTEEMVTKHMKESFHENQLDLKRKYINFGDALPYVPNCCEKLVRNNIFHKNSSFLFCFSCQCSAGQYTSFEDHITSQHHLNSFTGIFISIDADSTEKKDLVPPALPESEDQFKTYYENCIEKRGDSYNCHVCKVQIFSLSDVNAHISHKNHSDVKNSVMKKYKPSQCSLYFYELCVRNAIFQKYTDQLQCFACSGSTIGMKNFDVHIASKKHKHQLVLRQYSSSFSKFDNLESEITANSRPASNSRISESDSISIPSRASSCEIIYNGDISNHQLQELYVKCFQNYILVRGHDYFCNLCKIYLSTSSSVLAHINDVDHKNLRVERRENQDPAEEEILDLPDFIEILVRHNIFFITNSTLKCFSCECIISEYINAEQHIGDDQHKKNHKIDFIEQSESVSDLLLKSQDVFTTYFTNFIEKRQTDYHCHLCRVDLPPTAVNLHLKDRNHCVLVNKTMPASNTKTQNYLCLLEMCIRNGLFQIDFSDLKCFKCRVSFKFTKSMVETHVRSNEHKNSISSVSIADQTASDSKPEIFNNFDELTSSELKDLMCKYFNNYIHLRTEDYYCNLCNLKLAAGQINEHLEDSGHKILLKKTREEKKIADTPAYILDIVEKVVKNNIFQKDSTSLYCFACGCPIWPVFSYQKHIETERHKNNLRSYNSKDHELIPISDYINLIETEIDYHQYFENFIFKDHSDYFCHACFKSMTSSLQVNTHMHDQVHKSKVLEKKQIMNIMVNIPFKRNVYQNLVRNNIFAHDSQSMKCMSCHFVLPSFMDVELHIQSKCHLQKHGFVNIESPGEQNASLINDRYQFASRSSKSSIESISSGCRVLNISQTESRPLYFQRILPAGDSRGIETISTHLLSRDVYNYSEAKKTAVCCVVCYKKLESRVFLHAHLTSHFWELFTDKSIWDLMALSNLNGDAKIVISSKDTFVGMVPTDPTVERRKALLKNQALLSGNEISSENAVVPELWVNETEMEIYEHKNEKQENKNRDENDFSQIDIEEDEIPKKFDIYEIDKEFQNANQLSLSRICVINKDKIYCMICRKSVDFSVRIVYEHFRSVEHSHFLMQMVQDHIKFKAFSDEFSDLSLARELIEDKNDRYVACHVCDPVKPINIPNTNDALKNHINQQRHLESKYKLSSNLRQFKTDFYSRLERSWSNIHRYWCVVCDEKFKYEKTFYKHLNTKNHQRKCNKYASYGDFICDFCPTCGLLLYGFKNSFTYHSSCKFHQYYADRTFYLITRLPSAVEDLLVNAEKVVDSKVEALDSEYGLMKHEEKLLIDDLKNTIKDYVEAEIYPFGSRVIGFGSSTSDLDLFLDCDDLYHRGTAKTDISIFLREVEYALKQHEDIWTIKRTILDCRTPIIKIAHQVTSIDCDLSFTNGLSVENSKLVKSYVKKFPLCRKLILFIKDWINISNLDGENGICSYAVAWMVIYYFQTKFILPSVTTLITMEGKSRLISGWETGASTDFYITNSDYDFKDLLRGFFIMCAGFDYRNNIICPLLGRPLKKLDIIKPEKLTNLPEEMVTYKNYILKKKEAQRFNLDSVIAVQDPFDLSNNLTKAVKKATMYRFKTFCALSAEKLTN